jgi:N-acetylmuramoyl-L-alanine amidase
MSNANRRIGRARFRAGDDPLGDRLAGLRVAIDRAHLYRPHHPLDRGASFLLPSGARIDEAELILGYARPLANWLRRRGAEVLEPDPRLGIMLGEYPERCHTAGAWFAHCYLSCHVNAGRGRYALAEYFYPAGKALAVWITHQLAGLPSILYHGPMELKPGDRGAVCVREFAGAGVIVEPFFGDTARHQFLMRQDGLTLVAEAIGEGVAHWWESADR